ncbi:MAG: ribosome silencing factor, partial [Planctomycetota bacterium]
GEDIKILDVRSTLPILDYFILVTGKNRRHLRSMADEVRRLLREMGREVPREEGGDDGGRWLLLDFGDAIVHLFDKECRAFYDLDGLWADAPLEKLDGSSGRKKAKK